MIQVGVHSLEELKDLLDRYAYSDAVKDSCEENGLNLNAVSRRVSMYAGYIVDRQNIADLFNIWQVSTGDINFPEWLQSVGIVKNVKDVYQYKDWPELYKDLTAAIIEGNPHNFGDDEYDILRI